MTDPRSLEKHSAKIYQFPMTARAVSAASATDEAGSVPVAEGDIPREPPQDFLKDARRKLAQDPAVAAQWSPYEIERLDFEVSRLRREVADLRQKNESLSEKYSDEKVELERLRGEGKISKRNEILSTLIIAAGRPGLA